MIDVKQIRPSTYRFTAKVKGEDMTKQYYGFSKKVATEMFNKLISDLKRR